MVTYYRYMYANLLQKYTTIGDHTFTSRSLILSKAFSSSFFMRLSLSWWWLADGMLVKACCAGKDGGGLVRIPFGLSWRYCWTSLISGGVCNSKKQHIVKLSTTNWHVCVYIDTFFLPKKGNQRRLAKAAKCRYCLERRLATNYEPLQKSPYSLHKLLYDKQFAPVFACTV